MRWQTPDPLGELYGRAWQPAAPFWPSGCWMLRQWDWRREAFRPELHLA